MLLRLVPPAPLPTILFTLAFPNLPASVQLPAAWAAHLQLLADTGLIAPPSLHALDKSVVWTALLDCVSFDIETLTVTCTFIDGMHAEWPLPNSCVALLQCVVRDVSLSALENAPPPPAPPVPIPAPKKRRSILTSLVQAFSLPSSPPPPPVTPPPPQVQALPPSRLLRRRARSALVDAYRRFVAPTLVTHAPSQYALWTALSTARRAAREISLLVHAEDDGDTNSTSDGSSVHTPEEHAQPVLPQEAYHILHDLHARHVDLARRLMAHDAQQEAEAEAQAAVLEVRSRRRAWSTGWRGGSAGWGLGLSTPTRPSPLCQSWTREDVERNAWAARPPLRRAWSVIDKHPRGDMSRWNEVAVGVGRPKPLPPRVGELSARARRWSDPGKDMGRENMDVDGDEVGELVNDMARMRVAVGTGVGVECYEVHEEDEDEDEEEEMFPPTPTDFTTITNTGTNMNRKPLPVWPPPLDGDDRSISISDPDSVLAGSTGTGIVEVV